MFIYRTIKHYKELWKVEKILGQDAWKLWRLKPLSKQYGSGLAEIRSIHVADNRNDSQNNA
jgi:hypothetical protein